MSSIPQQGGPAFPYAFHFPEQDGEPGGINFGMSLRDYFAAHAPTVREIPSEIPYFDDKQSRHQSSAERYAQWSYAYADAMLAERAKKAGAA